MKAAPSDGDMYERIVAAILDQKLKPGTRLVEQQLAQAFGVSRTRIRPVLMRLAHEQLVTLAPHRGAVVARPDRKDCAEVFEVRALIEPVLVTHFMDHADAQRLEQLEHCIASEELARRQGDLENAIRLSGQFHLLLAQGSGHDTLQRLLRKMVSRTSLILMDQAPDRPARSPMSCACSAHRNILRAIRQGCASDASQLMRQHLLELQMQCTPPLHRPAGSTLRDIFAMDALDTRVAS